MADLRAERRSVCWMCERPVAPGDPITMADGWVHARCAAQDPNPLCGVCWLHHPEGTCDG